MRCTHLNTHYTYYKNIHNKKIVLGMKKIVFSALALMMASTATVFAGDNISESELPQRARSFIATCFAQDPVSSIEKDYNDLRGTEYEVELASGFEVDFNSNGTWRKISAAPGQAIASNFMPKKIAQYLDKNYPDVHVTKMLKNHKGYEVELSNDHDLHFDKDENFVKIDR